MNNNDLKLIKKVRPVMNSVVRNMYFFDGYTLEFIKLYIYVYKHCKSYRVSSNDKMINQAIRHKNIYPFMNIIKH